MGKWISRICFWIVEIGVAYHFWFNGHHWALSIFYAILCVEVPAYTLLIVYNIIGANFPVPLWWQRSFYEAWKKQLMKKKISPLVDYPFHIFLTFELDKHFEQGGVKAAKKAINDWVDEYQKKLKSALQKIAESQKSALEIEKGCPE